MGKFIKVYARTGSIKSEALIRADHVSYIGQNYVDSSASVVGYGSEIIVVDGEPAEVLAKIEAAEVAVVEPAAVRPETMRVDDLQVGDEVEIAGQRQNFKRISSDGDHWFYGVFPLVGSQWIRRGLLAYFLARGAIVRRDGKVISGWPVGESGVAVANDERVAQLEAELAEAKRQLAEKDDGIPRLDPNRIMATAYSLSREAIESSTKLHYRGRNTSYHKAVMATIEVLYGGGPPKLVPYSTTHSL